MGLAATPQFRSLRAGFGINAHYQYARIMAPKFIKHEASRFLPVLKGVVSLGVF